MLNTTRSIGFAANFKKTKAKIGDNNIVDNSLVGGSKVTNLKRFTKGKNQAKTTKFIILVKSKNRDFSSNSKNMKAGSGFFIFKTRLIFIILSKYF